MARRKTPKPVTLADRLAEVDEAIAATQEDLNTAAAEVADNATDKALTALSDARTALANLQQQRSNLQLAQKKQAEQATEAAEAQQAQQLHDLRAQLDELLAKRAEAAQQVADAFDAVAGPVAALGVVEDDLHATVAALSRLTARERPLPNMNPAATIDSLLDRVWRSGLAQCRILANRITVSTPFGGFSKAPLPVGEAVAKDNSRLVERIDQMLASVVTTDGQSWVGIHAEREQARREHEQRHAEAAMRDAKAEDARQTERQQRRAASNTVVAPVHDSESGRGFRQREAS